MTGWSLAAIAGITLAFIALQTLRPGLVPPAIVFLAAGLVCGPEGLGWITLTPDAEALKLLAEATLAFVLFTDAARIDLRSLRAGYAIPARLLGIGLPLSIVAGALAAHLVLPALSAAECLVLATVLAATDAALGQAVVTDPRLPAAIRQGLNVESGLNDGLCVPILVVALALAGTEADALSAADAGRIVAESIGYGLLMGGLAGFAGALVHRQASADPARWRRLLSPVLAALAYGLAAPLGGSGFIAAFVAGAVFGMAGGHRRPDAPPLPADDLGVLLNAVTFIVFGAAFIKPLLERATWQDAVYAGLSLTVIRMLPVAVALLGTRSSRATVAFVGWSGPRGLASIVFAVIVVEAGVPHTATVVDATTLTVAASVVAHGLTARPLTDRYVRRLGRAAGPPAPRPAAPSPR